VRRSFNKFRYCYEKGLAINPKLAGKVAVKFVIDKTGKVVSASDAGSTLASSDVVQCIVHGFTTMVFPAPKDGIVTVTYPFTISPPN
jgi:hypothetical protein